MISRFCSVCKKPGGTGKRELRPYGLNGADLCAGCVFGEDDKKPNQKLLNQAKNQMEQQIAMAGSQTLILDTREQIGPRPLSTTDDKN